MNQVTKKTADCNCGAIDTYVYNESPFFCLEDKVAKADDIKKTIPLEKKDLVMISKITFAVALVLTLFVIGNIAFWEYLQYTYKYVHTFSEIKNIYFSFFPEFLEGKVLFKTNFYFSITSIILFIISILSQVKTSVLRTLVAIVLQIVNILIMLLMFIWQYL